MLPETRAAFLKEAVASLAALGPEHAARARSLVPAQVLHDVDRARPLEWLPAFHALAILRAIAAVGGDDGVRRCSVVTIEASFRAPLLRAFVEVALSTLGVGPLGVVRTVARAWPLHYRNGGELVVVDDGPGALRVVHVGLPALLQEHEWMLSLATCIGRAAALAADGATAEPRDEGHRVVYAVRWPTGEPGR